MAGMDHDRSRVWRRNLSEYVASGCKPRAARRVGIEVETIGVQAETGTVLPYDGGRASVVAVIDHYRRARGGEVVGEGGRPVGLVGPWGRLSLEPGGQVEWASPPCSDLAQLGRMLDGHQETLRAAAEALGVRWLDRAIGPDVATGGTVAWMPLERVQIMRAYMAGRGRLAHQTMTRTASVHCAVDYQSPTDWARKFRAIVLLTPVVVALFANSPCSGGPGGNFVSSRQALWRETDPQRSTPPPSIFTPDFNSEDWLDWVCRLPTILRATPDGGVAVADGRPYDAWAARVWSEADWELHLSTILTPARAYRYLEARAADRPPDHRILAVPAFWCGLLYDDRALEDVLGVAEGLSDAQAWTAATEAAARLGLAGFAGGTPLRDLAARALSLAIGGLKRDAGGSDATLRRLADELGLALDWA